MKRTKKHPRAAATVADGREPASMTRRILLAGEAAARGFPRRQAQRLARVPDSDLEYATPMYRSIVGGSGSDGMYEKPQAKSFHLLSTREADTDAIATAVASHLRIGDTLVLTGDLACGKTYFVKGLAAALGCTDLVTSPTYALVHSYRTDVGDLMHIDAYRLSDIREFRDLCLEDYLVESIAAIEWGDKVAADFDDYLSIAFHLADAGNTQRLLTFSCAGERWSQAMATLKEEVGGSDDEACARH